MFLVRVTIVGNIKRLSLFFFLFGSKENWYWHIKGMLAEILIIIIVIIVCFISY